MLRVQEEFTGHQGALGAPRGCRGHWVLGTIRGCQGCIGFGRKCRCSGASRGIGGIGGS